MNCGKHSTVSRCALRENERLGRKQKAEGTQTPICLTDITALVWSVTKGVGQTERSNGVGICPKQHPLSLLSSLAEFPGPLRSFTGVQTHALPQTTNHSERMA